MKAVLADLNALRSSPAVKRGTVNEDAWWLFMQGKNLTDTHFPADALAAVDHFEKAIGLDPSFARAHAGLAEALILGSRSGGGTQDELTQRAKAAVMRALDLNGDLAEAHAVLGQILMTHEWDFEKAEHHLRRSTELEPNAELGHALLAEYLAVHARFDEALPEIRLAMEIDPKSCANHISYGRYLYFSRRYDDAIVQFRRVIEVFSHWTTAYSWLSMTYEVMDDLVSAYDWFIESQRQMNVPAERIAMFEQAHGNADWTGLAQKLMELDDPKNPSANFYALAKNAFRIGDKDPAFNYLNESADTRQYQILWLNVDPFFDPLRADPRFGELVGRIGLV